MNLVDNSIWWLDVGSPPRKRLWIGPTDELDGPAIVIANNGPGFIDPPEVLTQPFMSRRTDGMGLGLHLASEVMKAQGGTLAFPEHDDITLPRAFRRRDRCSRVSEDMMRGLATASVLIVDNSPEDALPMLQALSAAGGRCPLPHR